jgi:hypothetical protein
MVLWGDSEIYYFARIAVTKNDKIQNSPTDILKKALSPKLLNIIYSTPACTRLRSIHFDRYTTFLWRCFGSCGGVFLVLLQVYVVWLLKKNGNWFGKIPNLLDFGETVTNIG